MFERIHVLGNGPSWKQFSKIRDSDIVIGCNLPPIECDYTSIVDYDFVMTLERLSVINLPPVIASEPVSVGKSINVFAIYTPSGNISRVSAANQATLWALENTQAEIHVWGIDSYFNGSLESYTDSIEPRNNQMKKMPNPWKRVWDQIKIIDTENRIIFHAPTIE